MEDFNVLYVQGCDQRKPTKKVVNNAALRSHRGLIVHVTCTDKESSNAVVGKITFVDLAGCQDSKRSSTDRTLLAENVKMKKSLYAMLNVVCALNCDESYVPYRESILTRLLQDSLCRSSGAVFITCLKPNFCQYTIHAVSLASRSCQAINQQKLDSAKCTKGNTRFVPPWSPLNANKNEMSQLVPLEKKESGTPSITKRRPQPLLNSVRRSAAALYGSTETKVNVTPSVTKKKLFNARTRRPLANSVQSLTSKSLFNHRHPSTNPKQDGASLRSTVVDDSSMLAMDEISLLCTVSDDSSMPTKGDPTCLGNTDVEQEADSEQFIDQHDNHIIERNKHSSLVIYGSSPPLSERLKEISNLLKLISTKLIPQVDTLCTRQSNIDAMEPKTPTLPFHSNLDDCSKCEDTSTYDTFEARSTGLKNIDDCSKYEDTSTTHDSFKARSTGLKTLDDCSKYEETSTPHDTFKARSTGLKNIDDCSKYEDTSTTHDSFKAQSTGLKTVAQNTRILVLHMINSKHEVSD